MLSRHAVAQGGSDTVREEHGDTGGGKLGRTLLGHCHGDMGSAPEPWHGHVPSPAHSLLSAFSTQKRVAAAGGAVHGRWREGAAGGATRGQRGPFGALTRSLCLSLPPRCVFRSARAASKRGPRWAAARRGVPTPTTTRVPSTQVSPQQRGRGRGTWGPPHPKAPSEQAEIGDGVGWGLPVADGEVLGVPNLWFVSRIWLLSAQIFVEMVARRGLRPCCCSGTPP